MGGGDHHERVNIVLSTRAGQEVIIAGARGIGSRITRMLSRLPQENHAVCVSMLISQKWKETPPMKRLAE